MQPTFIPLTNVISVATRENELDHSLLVAKMTFGSSSNGHGVLDGVTPRKGGVFPVNIS